MGRAEKYANIQDKYKEKEVEEKLSTTREIKFKDVQEKEPNYEDTAPISLEEYEEITKSMKVVSNETKEEEKENVSLEKHDDEERNSKPDEEKKDEDIYLTSSFKPFRKKFRLKKVFRVLFTLFFLVGIGFAIYFFLVKPGLEFLKNVQPIQIYYNSIDSVADYILNSMEEDAGTNKYSGDFDIEFKSNIEGYKEISNYTYGFSYGLDLKNKSAEDIFYVKYNNQKFGNYVYFKDDKTYIKYSNSEDIYDISTVAKTEDDVVYQLFNSIMDELEGQSVNDYRVVVDEFRNILKESITKDMVKASPDTIEVNGKSIKVIKNTISLDRKGLEDFDKKICDKVLENDNFLKSFMKVTGFTKEEVIEYFLDNDYKDDESLIVNIYTIKGTKFAGFDIESNGFRDYYVYLDNKDFEAHFNFTDEDAKCDKKEDCALDNQEIYDVVGKEKDNVLNVDIDYNKKEFAHLKIRTMNENKIDLHYELIEDKEIYSGDILFIKGDNSYHLDISFQNGSEYLNMNVNYSYSYKKDVAVFNEDKIVPYSKSAMDTASKAMAEDLDKNGILEGYLIWSELANGIIGELSDMIPEVSNNVVV